MDENNPFLPPEEGKSQFKYLEATSDELKIHLNSKLTAKALQTYEHLMLNSKDEKIRKACADAIMEHSSTSSKSQGNLPGTQINVQFNEYVSKAAKSLLGVAQAATGEDDAKDT